MSKKSRRPRPDPTALASTCAWCAKHMPEGAELYAFGARVRAGVDLSRYEGQGFPMLIAEMDRTVTAIVPAANSQAKRHGFDLLFAACSPTCGETLREILIRQVHVIDQVYRGRQ